MALHRLEVLLRIKRGGSFDEDVERIGGDDVELVGGGQQVVARVVEDDVRARIEHDAVILRRRRYCVEAGGITGSISQTVIFSNAGIAGERSGGDTGAEADAEHRFRIGMQQGGQMADHALQLHVVEFGGRFHVAVDVDVDRAVRSIREIATEELLPSAA